MKKKKRLIFTFCMKSLYDKLLNHYDTIFAAYALSILFQVHVFPHVLLFLQQVMLPQCTGLMYGYTFEYVFD